MKAWTEIDNTGVYLRQTSCSWDVCSMSPKMHPSRKSSHPNIKEAKMEAFRRMGDNTHGEDAQTLARLERLYERAEEFIHRMHPLPIKLTPVEAE